MKIVKNYLYNVGYQVLVMILPLITVPYISRVIGTQGVGINAFTNSTIQYFILFASIGINIYGNRSIAYVRDNKQELSKIFWEIAILRFITVAVTYGVFLVFLSFVHRFQVYLLYQSLLIIAVAFDISWFFMGIEDFRKTVLRNTFVKLISVILIFTLVKTRDDLAIYILILSVSTLVGNLTLWPYLKRELRPVKFSELNVWRHFQPSLYLFLPQIAIQIYLVVNKSMLGIFTSVEAAGYFDNADKLVKVILAIVTATGTVMLPRVANTFAQGKKEQVNRYLKLSFDAVSLIAVPMTFGLMAIAPKFANWFFGSEFIGIDQLVMVLAPVIILIGWSNVTGQQYLIPTHKMKFYNLSVTIGACANIILNLLFIPLWGALGACITTVISELIVTGVQLYAIRKFTPLKEMFENIPKYFISGILMFGIVYWMNISMEFSILHTGMQILSGMLLYGIGLLILQPTSFKLIREFLQQR